MMKASLTWLIVYLMTAGLCVCHASAEPPSAYKSAQIEYEHFFNHGNSKKMKESLNGPNSKLLNEVLKSKVEVLGEVLKQRVQASLILTTPLHWKRYGHIVLLSRFSLDWHSLHLK